MVRDTGRIFDWGSESYGNSQGHGYGGGGGASSHMNAPFHRDCRMGAVGNDDEETWAPAPPDLRLVARQVMEKQGGSLASTPSRQERSPASPRSPILGHGSRLVTSTLFSMGATPTSAAGYSDSGSTLAEQPGMSLAPSTNETRTDAAPPAVMWILGSRRRAVL